MITSARGHLGNSDRSSWFIFGGGYVVMSLRYDWPPKRGTSVGLAIDTPAKKV